jgi:hypothetical protein
MYLLDKMVRPFVRGLYDTDLHRCYWVAAIDNYDQYHMRRLLYR